MGSTNAALTIAIVTAAVALFYGPWQWVCTDWIRQICFEARDRLFDLAVQNRLEFTSPEYRSIRATIEAEIRFAHEMTLPYIFLMGAYMRLFRPDMVARTKVAEQAIRERIIDADTRLEVDRLIGRMNRDVLRLLMLKSPVLVLVPIIVVGPFYLCLKAVQSYMRIVARFATTIIRLGASAVSNGDDFDGMSALPPA